MANKDKANKTSFSASNQPENKGKRGKAFKTILLEVIREESLIGANPDLSKEEAERLYISYVSKRAFDSDDTNSATLLKELLSKSYPTLKSTLPTVDFEFSESSKPSEQAAQILKAASDGKIPPDVAQIFISSIASMMKIEEVTEIAKRLDEIEKALGVSNA